MSSYVDTKPDKRPISRLILPFQEFVHKEASGGLLLLAFTIIALVWANSPLSHTYTDLWNTHLIIGAGSFKLDKPLLLWINDGLMAIFFFVVGLEIKREIMIGELSSPRKAALPIAAAVGGMVVPAAIYLVANSGQPSVDGWGVPMATDIAFALGVLSLLGKRAPLSLKVFITALAIVDDIGAILVIALFYTSNISGAALAIGAVFFAAMLVANRLGVRNPLIYGVLFVGLWVAFVKSGVHATVAGVLAAMTIPARTLIDGGEFLRKAGYYLETFGEDECTDCMLPTRRQRAALQALESASQHVESPMQRLEHQLHPWVSFAIMPVFALANAGVVFGGDLVESLTSPIALGIIGGLVIGKPVGIALAAWLAVRAGIADLPKGITWRHVVGGASLAGIGFTMSIFIASLAFEADLLNAAKINILVASLVSGLIGWFLLRSAGQAQA